MTAMDYCGGDLYGGALFRSVACKLCCVATRDRSYKYMLSRWKWVECSDSCSIRRSACLR